MSSESEIKIEKLQDSSQWLTWKFQMVQILEAGEMFGVVNGEELLPSAGEQEQKSWRKLDAKARRTISTALGKQPLLQILNCASAKSMWDTLKSVYEQTSTASVLFLLQKYYSYSKDPEDDIATFLSKLMEIVQHLRDQGEIISDSMIMTKVLISLPAEYNHFHSAWESVRPADQNLNNLRARLMAEEIRLSAQEKVKAEAFVARHQSRPKTKKHQNNNRKTTTKGGLAKSAKNETQHKNVEALVCGANVSGKQESWMLDSGATDHMSNRRDWFVTFEHYNDIVRVGDGRAIKAAGKGDINVLVNDGQEWVQKVLTNVL
ncbi:uncharacterized protein LOC118745454 [Rhagoletis pomonella]|uniref:uncharacterized protein LOC118745454 n=1 Tax=Rhagoletis pomonella TaxID=28610 RepID=UPI001784DE4F|nr:uncharacterized protein LOC118745454 [Rhagoletis pomonella]